MKTKIELANVMAEINIKIGECIEDSNARKGGDIYKHTDAFKAINQALQNYNEYIGGADYTGKVSNEIINNIFKKYEPSVETMEAARAFIINNVEPDTHEPAAAAPAPAPMKGFPQEEIERAIAESLKIPNALYAPPEPAPAPMKGFSQEEIERAIAESFESLNALPAFPRVGAAAAAGHYNAGSDQSKSYVSSSDAHRFDFNSRDTSAVSEVQSGLNKLYNTYKSKLNNYGSIVKYDEEKNEIARYVLQHLNELKSNSLMLGDELLSIPGLFYTNEVELLPDYTNLKFQSNPGLLKKSMDWYHKLISQADASTQSGAAIQPNYTLFDSFNYSSSSSSSSASSTPSFDIESDKVLEGLSSADTKPFSAVRSTSASSSSAAAAAPIAPPKQEEKFQGHPLYKVQEKLNHYAMACSKDDRANLVNYYGEVSDVIKEGGDFFKSGKLKLPFIIYNKVAGRINENLILRNKLPIKPATKVDENNVIPDDSFYPVAQDVCSDSFFDILLNTNELVERCIAEGLMNKDLAGATVMFSDEL